MGLNVLVLENDELSFRTIRHVLGSDADLHACRLIRATAVHGFSNPADLDLAVVRQRLCVGMERHDATRLGIRRKTSIVLISDEELPRLPFGEIVAQLGVPIAADRLTAALALAKAALIGRRMQELLRLVGGYAKFLREGERPSGGFPCAPQAIEWIQSNANYVTIHTASGDHIVRMTMASAEEGLKSSDVIRIHRRCLVNRTKIKRVLQDANGEFVLTVSGQRLRVGRAYRKILFDAIIDHPPVVTNLLETAFT